MPCSIAHGTPQLGFPTQIQATWSLAPLGPVIVAPPVEGLMLTEFAGVFWLVAVQTGGAEV